MCYILPAILRHPRWSLLVLLSPVAFADVPPETSSYVQDRGDAKEEAIFRNAGELDPGAQALVRQRFAGWALQWVANVSSPHVQYSVVYGTGERRSAMILIATDTISGTSRILKADNSLFPFDEHRTGTPPLEVRIAMAEALVRKNAAPFGSISNYVTALRRYDMLRYLAPEQRQAIINLGGHLPKL
jgi:hypothetical protein